MRPKEAVLLPLPCPVFTIRSGLSLLDLRRSLFSRGSRTSLTPPASSPPARPAPRPAALRAAGAAPPARRPARSEEHTSELQSRQYLVCRLLLEKKKNTQ